MLKLLLVFCLSIQIALLEAETDRPRDNQTTQLIESFAHSLKLREEIVTDQFSYEPLTGGFSGASLCRFDLNNHSFVIRVFKPELAVYDRTRQILSAKFAGEIGIAPKVYFVDPNLKGFIMDYVNGRTSRTSDLQSVENLVSLASTIKYLHTSKKPFPEARSPLLSFQLSVAKGERMGTPYPTKFQEVRKLMEEIQGILLLNPVPPVPTHLDLIAQNILLKDSCFLLIDWENGGLSDPYFDLSMLSVFFRLDENQTKQFLKTYFGRPPTEFEWDRFIVAQPICLFLRASQALSDRSEKERTTQFYDEALTGEEIPKYSETIQQLAEGKLNLPRWKVGLSLMEGGLELAKSEQFKTSFQRLQNSVRKRIYEDSTEHKKDFVSFATLLSESHVSPPAARDSRYRRWN